MEEKKILIKDAKVTKDVAHQKAQHELGQDIQGYFGERDKTLRGMETKMKDMEQMTTAEAEVKEVLYNDSLVDKEIPEGIQPMFNQMFVSARRNKTKTDSGIWVPQALFSAGKDTDAAIDFQPIQKVMAVGPQCQQCAVGMEVVINFENFRKRLEQSMAQQVKKESVIDVPTIEIDGKEYLRISERDLEYIYDTKGIKINN